MNTPSSPDSFDINDHHNQKKGKFRFFVLVVILALFFIGLFLFGFLPRAANHRALDKTAESTTPVVNVVALKHEPKSSDLILPGDLVPWLQTQIYGRTNGYVKQRFVDIGDSVRKGEVLATIETPEIDQELGQSQATLAQSKATLVQQQTTLDYSKATLNRWKTIANQEAVSRQETDDKQLAFNSSLANVSAAKSVVKANQANVNRLQAFEAFKKVVAPFSGVITERNVDAGALIVSGGSVTSTYLFKIAQIDTLRIWIAVPETFAPDIHSGIPAKVMVSEFPGQVFEGTVSRTAGSLDLKTRTLLTEIRIPNASKKLLPGMFAQVTLDVTSAKTPLLIPDTALVSDAKGTRVIIVKPDHTLHYQTVSLGRDFGTEMEVLAGLTGQEHLVVNPSDDLVEGESVDPVLQKPTKLAKQ